MEAHGSLWKVMKAFETSKNTKASRRTKHFGTEGLQDKIHTDMVLYLNKSRKDRVDAIY